MLTTSRTPLRVSFFGGGTDYPAYFKRHPGAVIGMAVDRYIYISVLKLADIIDYRYRVTYSRLERTKSREEIIHPVVAWSDLGVSVGKAQISLLAPHSEAVKRE